MITSEKVIHVDDLIKDGWMLTSSLLAQASAAHGGACYSMMPKQHGANACASTTAHLQGSTAVLGNAHYSTSGAYIDGHC